MKRAAVLVGINLAVTIALVVCLELFLRAMGMETISEADRRSPEWRSVSQRICSRIEERQLAVADMYFTGADGIFKANRAYFSSAKSRAADGVSINAEGFRGNEFEPVATGRKKLFLIGDSFTWGQTARPIALSFADRLQAAGYHVYNGGIPGTDTQQYALVAEKYVPRLEPDVVAVFVFLGNDVEPTPFLFRPNKTLHYVTSVGFLRGYDDNGNFFENAAEAVRYLENRKCGRATSPWGYLLFQTVVGRGIFGALYHGPGMKSDPSRRWVVDNLNRIKRVSERNGARFVVFLIPARFADVAEEESLERNLHLFAGFEHHFPRSIVDSDYQRPANQHFNNKGHRKYADFVIDVLTRDGYPPLR